MVVIQWFSQTILSSQTLHYSFHFLSLPNPTPSNLPHIPPLILFIFFLSTIKWQNTSIGIPTKSFVFIFWIVWFMFLNHLNIPYTPNPLFHPISFFSSRIHSLISFRSYTASCITNLDNSVHPFHPSSSNSSSFHTPYQSASTILCNTIYPSFSTNQCTLPHILLTQVMFPIRAFFHSPSYTFKNNILDWVNLPFNFNLNMSSLSPC